jgi:hydrogenase/urease accessory protein HupE
MNKRKVLVTTAILLMSSPVFAHSGHDHTAANAGLVHMLWLAPAIVAMAVISYRKIKAKSTKNN